MPARLGHVGLAAQLAVGADLLRDARDFGGERTRADRPSLLTVVPMRRNSPLTGWPSISSAIFCVRSPSATALMTRATSVVGCTRSPISALIEPTLAAQPPFISRRRHALGHPPLAPDDALDAHHLAGEGFVQRHHRVELGRDRAASPPGRRPVCCFAVAGPVTAVLAATAVLAVRAVRVRRIEAQPDREVPLPRRTQRCQQAAERTVATGCPATRRPFGSGARRSIWRRVFRCRRSRMSLVLPRRIQGLVLRVRRRRPSAVPARQALRPLNRQAVDVGTPEKPASADRSHRRQAAIVGQDADGVRRKSEHARCVARGEEVVGIGVFMVDVLVPGSGLLELQGRDVTTSTNPARGPRRKSGLAPKSPEVPPATAGDPGVAGGEPSPGRPDTAWIRAFLDRPAGAVANGAADTRRSPE